MSAFCLPGARTVGPGEGALHWELGPGFKVLLRLYILGTCHPLPCASVLPSIQWAYLTLLYS